MSYTSSSHVVSTVFVGFHSRFSTVSSIWNPSFLCETYEAAHDHRYNHVPHHLQSLWLSWWFQPNVSHAIPLGMSMLNSTSHIASKSSQEILHFTSSSLLVSLSFHVTSNVKLWWIITAVGLLLDVLLNAHAITISAVYFTMWETFVHQFYSRHWRANSPAQCIACTAVSKDTQSSQFS